MTEYVSSSILFYTNDNYIHEEHTVRHILYYLIFCPKRRKKVLVGPLRDRLEQIVREVAQENGWQVGALAIQPDHVHPFLQANPYSLPTDVAWLLKGRSSHDRREAFPHLLTLPSLWKRSIFSSTAGFVNQDIIQKYIERQRKSSC